MSFLRSYQIKLRERLKEASPLLQVLLGPRQVGKSTAARMIYDGWEGAKHMESADSPTPPSADWIRYQWQQAQNKADDALLIIDEIQKVPGWSEQIKILFDNARSRIHLKVLLLGSSSLNLQKGMGESLAGRFELTQAPHWTFSECRTAFGWDFETYLRCGGYPGAAIFAADEARWRDYVLHGIIEPVLSRDILSQTRVDKPALFRQCFELCAHYPAQEVSLNKILGQLQDRGNATTVKHYLDLFEKCFLILPLQKYGGSALAVRSSSPKIVPLNPALIHAYHAFDRLAADPAWRGRVFESVVGAHLHLIQGAGLYYWREGNAEVDYVVKTPRGLWALEVKSGFRKGGTKGLEIFSKKYPEAECLVWDEQDCLKFMCNEITIG